MAQSVTYISDGTNVTDPDQLEEKKLKLRKSRTFELASQNYSETANRRPCILLFLGLNLYYLYRKPKNSVVDPGCLSMLEPGSRNLLLTGIGIARTPVTTRTSVTFGFFYVLYHNFETRHYFNDVKVAKNS
jgi:hypothetical protein